MILLQQRMERLHEKIHVLEAKMKEKDEKIHVLEAKMKEKDEIIALLVSRKVPWEEVDPKDTVPLLERIGDAQNYARASRSRPVSPYSSRAPSPAPSDRC